MTNAIIETEVLGHRLRYRPLDVRTPDGLHIAAQDWGAPTVGVREAALERDAEQGARDVLLIHGIGQSHLCWLKQLTGPLGRKYRFVTYDLRGHGGSDKPLAPEYYRDGERWAREVRAVIEAAQLRHPAVVSWSYGGRVTLDYLEYFGGEGVVAGVVLAAATSNADPSMFGPSAPLLFRMAEANDETESLAAAGAFLRACTYRPIPAAEYQLMLDYNLRVPPAVLAAMVGRPAPYGLVLAGLTMPVLAIHGAEDGINLPAMAQYTIRTCPGARASIYEGVGHTPFWEAPERFDGDLARFLEGLPTQVP